MEAFGCFQGEGDQRGDGVAKLLFLQHPGPRWADMFLAENAHESSHESNRDIEHGRYAQRDEVALGELGCAGVVYGVRGIDDTFGE